MDLEARMSRYKFWSQPLLIGAVLAVVFYIEGIVNFYTETMLVSLVFLVLCVVFHNWLYILSRDKGLSIWKVSRSPLLLSGLVYVLGVAAGLRLLEANPNMLTDSMVAWLVLFVVSLFVLLWVLPLAIYGWESTVSF